MDTGAGRMRPMKFLRGIAVLLVFLQHHAMQSILHIKLCPLGAEVAAVLRNFDTRGLAANLAGLAALTVGDWSSPSQLGRTVMETLAPLHAQFSRLLRHQRCRPCVEHAETPLAWQTNDSYSLREGGRIHPLDHGPPSEPKLVPIFVAIVAASVAVFAVVGRRFSV